jgi:Na+/phosphate symporter
VEKGFTKLSPGEQLKQLYPLVDLIRRMLGAARHAFNRHSQKELEMISQLKGEFTLDVDPFFMQVETGLENALEAEKPDLIRIQEILTQLELMSVKIAGLADPIRRKGNQGTILPDKDLFFINDLFSRYAGFLRAMVDIFLYNDAALKSYLLNESKEARAECYRDESEHQTRMMDSPEPGAYITVSILELFRDSLGHLVTILEGLD